MPPERLIEEARDPATAIGRLRDLELELDHVPEKPYHRDLLLALASNPNLDRNMFWSLVDHAHRDNQALDQLVANPAMDMLLMVHGSNFPQFWTIDMVFDLLRPGVSDAYVTMLLEREIDMRPDLIQHLAEQGMTREGGRPWL